MTVNCSIVHINSYFNELEGKEFVLNTMSCLIYLFRRVKHAKVDTLSTLSETVIIVNS